MVENIFDVTPGEIMFKILSNLNFTDLSVLNGVSPSFNSYCSNDYLGLIKALDLGFTRDQYDLEIKNIKRNTIEIDNDIPTVSKIILFMDTKTGDIQRRSEQYTSLDRCCRIAGIKGEIDLIDYFIGIDPSSSSMKNVLIGLASYGDIDLFVSILDRNTQERKEDILSAEPFTHGSKILEAVSRYGNLEIFQYLLDTFDNRIFYPHWANNQLNKDIYMAVLRCDIQTLENLKLAEGISNADYMDSIFQVVPGVAVDSGQIKIFNYLREDLKLTHDQLIDVNDRDSIVVNTVKSGNIEIFEEFRLNWGMTKREALFYDGGQGTILDKAISDYGMIKHIITVYELTEDEIAYQLHTLYPQEFIEKYNIMSLIQD